MLGTSDDGDLKFKLNDLPSVGEIVIETVNDGCMLSCDAYPDTADVETDPVRPEANVPVDTFSVGVTL